MSGTRSKEFPVCAGLFLVVETDDIRDPLIEVFFPAGRVLLSLPDLRALLEQGMQALVFALPPPRGLPR